MRDSSLDGLEFQGMHLFTYAFVFVVSCKAAYHRWLERIDTRVAVRWFRVSHQPVVACALAGSRHGTGASQQHSQSTDRPSRDWVNHLCWLWIHGLSADVDEAP